MMKAMPAHRHLTLNQHLGRFISATLLCCTAIIATNNVQAQSTTNPIATIVVKAPNWSELTDNDKAILAPLESDWESLSTDMKQKWVQVAKKYDKLPATEQERLRSRMAEWSKLSPNERRIARENYLKNMKVAPEKKAEAWQAYQQLSPEEKKKLADEAAHKKPSLVNSPSLK